MRTLRIDIVRKILRIDTWIGGVFLLVKRLNEVERHLCREAELAVAVHLQRSEVIELRRLFFAFLLLDLRDSKRLTLNGLEGLFALFLRRKLALRGRKRRIAIDGCEHPIGLGFEILNLLLAIDDERQRGRLYTTNGEHLTVLTIP